MMHPPAHLKARVLASARRSPSPVRSSALVRTWLVLPLAVLAAAALFFALDGLDHGRGRPDGSLLIGLATWVSVAVFSLWGALGRTRTASWRPGMALAVVALGTPALLVGLSGVIAIAYPAPAGAPAPPFGARCFALTLAAAALPLVALLRARRDSDPVHPRLAGAALGSACGAAAGIVVTLWCPATALGHVLIGHVLPVLALSVSGALGGSRVLAMSRAR